MENLFSIITQNANAYLIILPFVFLAGIIDAIAGGGGLISVPAYLAAGLPPHFALGTNKFSSVMGTFVATVRYFKHAMIDIPVALTSGIIALVGSYLGAKTVLFLNPNFLNYILAILLPVIMIFSLLDKRIGTTNQSFHIPIRKRILLSGIAALVIGFYDGFFGPGTGTFLILFYTISLKYDFVTANGNTKVINLASNIAAVITFLISGKVLFMFAIPAAIVGIMGNTIGSHMVVQNGSKIIKPLFIIAFLLLFMKIVYTLLVS